MGMAGRTPARRNGTGDPHRRRGDVAAAARHHRLSGGRQLAPRPVPGCRVQFGQAGHGSVGVAAGGCGKRLPQGGVDGQPGLAKASGSTVAPASRRRASASFAASVAGAGARSGNPSRLRSGTAHAPAPAAHPAPVSAAGGTPAPASRRLAASSAGPSSALIRESSIRRSLPGRPAARRRPARLPSGAGRAAGIGSMVRRAAFSSGSSTLCWTQAGTRVAFSGWAMA